MLDLEEFLMLRDLFNQELSISEIARRTGHSRGTVRKYLLSPVPPAPQKRQKKPSKLDDYKEYIAARLQEYLSKKARSLSLRMRLARFPVEKRLDEFDFKFQPSVDKASIKEMASLKFIHNAENVVFLGPPGVGKTHLAIALGIEAAEAGFKVNFSNVSVLVERLAKAENEKKLEDKIRGLSKFQLLIIDEIGYLPFDELGAHCFFQLIFRRYEKASIILTSNKSYGE